MTGIWPDDASEIPQCELSLWSQWQLEGKASILGGLDKTPVSQ